MNEHDMSAECRERFLNLTRRMECVEADQKAIYGALNRIAESQARIETRLNIEEKYADMFRGAAVKVAVSILGASVFLGACIITAMKLGGVQ